MERAAAELAAWDSEHTMETLGKASVDVGAAVGAAAGEMFMTAIFGEPKKVREEREKKEAEQKAAREAETSKAADEKAAEMRELAEKAAAAEAAAEAAAKAAAEAEAERKAVAEAAASAAAEAEAKRMADETKAKEALDREVRRKREDAEKVLKARRDRSLSDVAVSSVLDAALGAAAAAASGTDAEKWAEERRKQVQEEGTQREKLNKLALFESDLKLLGLSIETAADLDEKALRKAFRDRSRILHPDMRDQVSEEELAGVPSVYELNAAFESIKKLL